MLGVESSWRIRNERVRPSIPLGVVEKTVKKRCARCLSLKRGRSVFEAIGSVILDHPNYSDLGLVVYHSHPHLLSYEKRLKFASVSGSSS